MSSNDNDEYWASYTPIQKAKHDLLRRYLGGWFPILASFSGRVVYMDCHAGQGRHAGGEAGSWVLGANWCYKHLRKALRALRDDGRLSLGGYTGRFAFSKNPTITFE